MEVKLKKDPMTKHPLVEVNFTLNVNIAEIL